VNSAHANGEVLNTIYLIFTFGLGGLINQQVAGPKCESGLDRLELGANENCDSCIADVESFPVIKGVGACSSGVFCIQDDLCGDAKMSMTFGKHGDLDVGTDLFSSFWTSSPQVYELRIVASPKNENEFEACTATVDINKECQSCNICADGISFTFDCSNQMVGSSNSAGPIVTDCLNFMFRK